MQTIHCYFKCFKPFDKIKHYPINFVHGISIRQMHRRRSHDIFVSFIIETLICRRVKREEKKKKKWGVVMFVWGKYKLKGNGRIIKS